MHKFDSTFTYEEWNKAMSLASRLKLHQFSPKLIGLHPNSPEDIDKLIKVKDKAQENRKVVEDYLTEAKSTVHLQRAGLLLKTHQNMVIESVNSRIIAYNQRRLEMVNSDDR